MINHFSCSGATTAEVWTTTPKSASCRLSPRSAISARASITWSPAAQSKHNSPRRALRENRLPWKETREVTATRRRLPRRQIKLKGRASIEAQKPIKLLRRRGRSSIPSRLLKLLLDLPQVFLRKKKFFPTGVTLRKTAVLLHSQSLLDERITAV